VTITYPNGAKYDGEMKDGKMHGQGILINPDGSKYIGEFIDDKLQGHGMFINSNGSKCIGSISDGKMFGQGIYVNPNGEQLIGEFKNNIHKKMIFINKNYVEGSYMLLLLYFIFRFLQSIMQTIMSFK